jgi:hypothetical protein
MIACQGDVKLHRLGMMTWIVSVDAAPALTGGQAVLDGAGQLAGVTAGAPVRIEYEAQGHDSPLTAISFSRSSC